MKIFSPAKEVSKEIRMEILNALRIMIERQGAGLRRDSFLSLTNDREDQFFLKSAQNFILWGKIYFDSFNAEKAAALRIEQEEMGRKFLQPMKLHVFLNAGDIDQGRLETYPEADYFHYAVIQSSAERAITVERVSFSKRTLIVSPSVPPGEPSRQMDYSFSKQSQLTRNELAELIDLSLDLKRS